VHACYVGTILRSICWMPVACGVSVSVRAGLIVLHCTQSPAPVIVRKGSLCLRLPRVSLVDVKEILDTDYSMNEE